MSDPTTTTDKPAVTVTKTAAAGDLTKQFIDSVVSLTKAKRDNIERFAKDYLPAYLDGLAKMASDDADTKTMGERIVSHIRTQITLKAATYGIQIEQSATTALWKLFNAALPKI